MSLDAAFVVNAFSAANSADQILAVDLTGAVPASVPEASRGILAVRPSDAHVFAFRNDTTVHEFDADLVFVQTFGNTAGDAASLVPQVPTNQFWDHSMIQFVGPSVYLGWTGYSSTFPHVAVQQRDAVTFALLATTRDFNAGLPPGSSQPRAMAPDGLTLYFNDVFFGVAAQHVAYAFPLPSGPAAPFASYGTWSGTTGWLVWDIRTTASGHVVVLYVHLTTVGGEYDDARIGVYTSTGTELITFPVLTTIPTPGTRPFPTRVFCVDSADTGIWTTGPLGNGPAYWDIYTQYRLSDGAVLQTLTPTVSRSPGGGMAGLPVVTPPPPVDPSRTPIRRLRRAPHLSAEQVEQFFARFALDLEAGVGQATDPGADPQIYLRWSDDGGHTWRAPLAVSAGTAGAFRRRAIWRRLGRSRDRVFEVSMSDPVKWALLAASLDATKGSS